MWQDVYNLLPYRPVAYLQRYLDYQLAYQQDKSEYVVDLSCIILHDRTPVAIWPLTISIHDNEAKVTSQGTELLPPIFIANCALATQKKILRSAMLLTDELAKSVRLDRWAAVSVFINSYSIGLWQLMAMNEGAVCHTRHELYVDLTLPVEKIKASFRKSYRPLISAGERLWKVNILENSTEENIWEEFRMLHRQVAGRSTRSKKTWDLQYESIVKGEGFLIYLRDQSNKMVGGGFFMHSNDEGTYAVGVYDRVLFDKPIGHIVQFRAIQELKQRSCRWYYIGRRVYAAEQPVPTEKELSISKFKEGFATNIFPSFVLSKPVLQI